MTRTYIRTPTVSALAANGRHREPNRTRRPGRSLPTHRAAQPTGAVLDASGSNRLVELARRTGTPLVDRRDAGRSPTRQRGRGATRHSCRAGLTAGPHGRIRQQDLLSRPAGGLDPYLRGDGAPVGGAARLDGPGQSSSGTAGGDPAAGRRRDVASARRAELAASRDHLLGRLSEAFPQWCPSHFRGLRLWVDLGAPVFGRLVGAARRHAVQPEPRVHGSGRTARTNATCGCALHTAPRPGRTRAGAARRSAAGTRPGHARRRSRTGRRCLRLP